MSETKVVNIKTNPEYKNDPNFIYIGRPGPFGNPFIIGLHGTRDKCIELYRDWINDQIRADELKALIERCKGKILGCYCAPKKCHGDVIKGVCDDATAS